VKYQRELTAAVLIPAVLAILVAAPPWAWAALVTGAGALALAEFYRLIAAAGWTVPRIPGFAVLLAVCGAAYFGSAAGLVAAAAAGLLLLPALVMFASPPVGVLLASSASSVFATLYVALGAAAMIALRTVGWRPVIFVLAVVWASDSAAYYVGRRFGKRKLAPVVSPKKTWEGLWGQLGAGLLVGLLARVLLFPSGSVPALALLGLAAAGLAVVGDLLESTFKRSCDVKDSGGLLPGHGGFLDRLDSLLYVSPAVLGVALWLPEVLPR
jgi:phosphatidate cytidylyltransferase